MPFETKAPRVLILDSNAQRGETLRQRLRDVAIGIVLPSERALQSRLSDTTPAVIVIGTLADGGIDAAIGITSSLRETHPDVKIVLLADQSSENIVIRALRAGAHEYFRPPASIEEVADAVMRLLTKSSAAEGFEEMVGNSDPILRVRGLLLRVAPSDGTILITGETGTGKELVARAIHRLSSRPPRPLICFNCSAVPDTLVESELFGYEKGAFTGAATRQTGLLTKADGGTLFLDEIGDMSLRAQAKILRALETGEVQPLGASKPHQVDMRVIAATHCDLTKLVSQNQFREDLFFRLNVIPIDLAPLRKRREDIPELVGHFVNEYNAHYHGSVEGVTPGALRFLCSQDWPGNIRQLRNVVQAGFLVSDRRWITESNLRELHRNVANSDQVEGVVRPLTFSRAPVQPEPERLLSALQATSWNKSKAAELLNWSRMTVYRKIAKYQLAPCVISPEEFEAAQAS